MSEVPTLEVRDFSAAYGSLSVVHDVNISVRAGEIVGLLGRNGAGKTTTLMAIAGYLGHTGGSVLIDGQPLGGPPYKRTRHHLGIVLEGRSVFPSLTVARNFAAAGVDLADAFAIFPELERRSDVAAGMLSGGEQQMLALARSMARGPRALLIDELSFGLAPIACTRLFTRLREHARETSTAVLLVEQHLHYAASVCDRVVVMSEGRIALETTAAGLAEREEEIERLYLADVTPASSK